MKPKVPGWLRRFIPSSSLVATSSLCTKKGREALFLFLGRTGIATRKWLIAGRSLEGGNSY
jgi:hypothetical protein